MKIRNRWIGVMAAGLLFSFTHPNTQPRLFTAQYENVLGTSMEIKMLAGTEWAAGEAEAAALTEINRLSGILSSYDPGSEFSRWSATVNVPVTISPELFEVLQLFQQWRSRTGGALDPAVGELTRLWKEAEKRQELPGANAISVSLQRVRENHYQLVPPRLQAIHLDQTPLILNSFTKSYIIRKVAGLVLQQPGISAVVLNIGGDIVSLGGYTEQVDLRDPASSADNDPPLQQLEITNQAVATSGNYRRGYRINGDWYSHIIDPRTGRPSNGIRSATVLAANATDAGALATAFNVLSPQESLALTASIPGAACLIIDQSGRLYASDHWPGKPLATRKPVSEIRGSQDWDPNYELMISLELTRFTSMTRRPFVAVWVEDADHHPVRTLALWFNKSRWLPDLKQWYRGNYAKFNESSDGVYSISSATRPAGKYTLRWDGKDDKGSLVKSGKYTVLIEAAREHGTYQIIQQEITCSGKEMAVDCEGNTEISAARLEYRKKQNGNGTEQ